MKKHSKILRSLLAIVIAILMVGSVIPTVALAADAEEEVSSPIGEVADAFNSFIQSIRDFFQRIINFFRDLFGIEDEPVIDAEVSDAIHAQIEAAQAGATIDGEGAVISAVVITKELTLKNFTFVATSKDERALLLHEGVTLTLENCTIKGKAWIAGKNIKLINCKFDSNINIENVEGLTVEGCTFTSSEPVTFGGALKDVTFENNTFTKTSASLRIHENIASIKNVKINDSVRISVDSGANAIYNAAVNSKDFVA